MGNSYTVEIRLIEKPPISGLGAAKVLSCSFESFNTSDQAWRVYESTAEDLEVNAEWDREENDDE